MGNLHKKTALMTGSYGGLGTCFVNIHASGENSSEKSTEICYHWNQEACPGLTKIL